MSLSSKIKSIFTNKSFILSTIAVTGTTIALYQYKKYLDNRFIKIAKTISNETMTKAVEKILKELYGDLNILVDNVVFEKAIMNGEDIEGNTIKSLDPYA